MPGLFLAVNGQHAGEELDLVAADFQGHVAGQRDGVEEHALTERHVERDFMGVGKGDGLRGVGARYAAGKGEGYVPDAELGLLDDEGGGVGRGGEGDLPWAVLYAAVFNETEGGDVEEQGGEKEDAELFGGAHGITFWEAAGEVKRAGD